MTAKKKVGPEDLTPPVPLGGDETPPAPPPGIDDIEAELLESLSEGMNQKYGDGTVYSLTGANSGSAIRWWLPMGLRLVEECIGRAGLPSGRIIEMYGEEGSGKTSLAMHMVAATQRGRYEVEGGGMSGAIAFVIDTERTLDEAYAHAIGVNTDRLVGIKARSIEEIFARATEVVVGLRAGELPGKRGQKIKLSAPFKGPILGVVDSVGQTATDGELKKLADILKKTGEAEEENALPMAAAKVIKQQLRPFVPLMADAQATCIFINHTYSVMASRYNKNPQPISYGGKGLKLASSIRIKTERLFRIMDEDTEIGWKLGVDIEKNKVSMPSGRLELEIIRGRGIRETGIYVDRLVETGRLPMGGGGWFTLPTESGTPVRLQGKEAVVKYLEEFPSALDLLLNKA